MLVSRIRGTGHLDVHYRVAMTAEVITAHTPYVASDRRHNKAEHEQDGENSAEWLNPLGSFPIFFT